MNFRFRYCLAAFILTLAAGVSRAENWPQWRGPRLDGTSTESNLPAKWSNSDNVLWRTALPGQAGATPIVWEDRIFVTSVDRNELVLLAFDSEGKQLWRQVVGRGNFDVRGDEGNAASPSPCTDGKHVWTTMGGGQLTCHDFEGREVWTDNLQERYGRFQIQFGMTSTPVLDGDRLYLQLIHSGGALVIALDKATGKEVWKEPRPSDAYAECEHSYASPTIYRDANRAYLLTHGADYVVAHDLDDGRELWRCGDLNPPGNYNETLRLVASPVAVMGLIVVPTAKNGPVLGISPDAAGIITDQSRFRPWTRPDNTPDVPSPLVHDGLVYLCRENGGLICLDAKTGEEVYHERTHAERHRASPVYGDGKVYLTARDGLVTVVKAGRTFETLSINELGEEISASPAISNGRIYLRTFDALYAIGQK